MSTMVDAARRGPGPLRSPTEIDGGLFGAGRRLINSHAVATDGLLAAGVLCLSTLWLVLSPFAGIGSEGVVSIQQGRRFVGCELKASYWRTAVENLQAIEQQPSLLTA